MSEHFIRDTRSITLLGDVITLLFERSDIILMCRTTLQYYLVMFSDMMSQRPRNY